MQEPITERAGRFMRLLAGRPPATHGGAPMNRDIAAPRADPVDRAAEAGVSAVPSHLTARPVRRARLPAGVALLCMLALCLVTCLLAAWRQLDVLAGLGFCAGCVLAPVYAR